MSLFDWFHKIKNLRGPCSGWSHPDEKLPPGPTSALVELEAELTQKKLLPQNAAMLVPGRGMGEDALYFAKKGFKVSVVDSEDRAILDIRRESQREKVSLEILKSDFFQIPGSWHGSFDIWVENGLFRSIEPKLWPKYVQQVLSLLHSDGQFVGVFFLKPKRDRQEIEKIRSFFSPHFDILKLEPSQTPGEWSAHFKRKAL